MPPFLRNLQGKTPKSSCTISDIRSPNKAILRYTIRMDFKPKLVAFDLDGTLAVSKSPVTKEMGNLLSRPMQNLPVAVLSGASFRQFETQLLPSIPSDANFSNFYLFPTNAGQCYRDING